jgi:site-specific DNA-methyltransferase (adenine-specific)
MFSFVGENVLDPFGGSGTTSLAAKNLDRNSACFEINADFIPIIKEKLNVLQKDISNTTYQFIAQTDKPTNVEDEIKRLPYIFVDPHVLDKKIDVKKLQFGSRIDKESAVRREEFFTVKKVISAEKLLLSNDLIVKLIGIKEDPETNGSATNFLINKTKGKRVFIKYDDVKYDRGNNLLCYVYLENKTFLNAHLLKNGFVKVDLGAEFKYKQKFLDLYQQFHYIFSAKNAEKKEIQNKGVIDEITQEMARSSNIEKV